MDQIGIKRCCLLLMWILFPCFPWGVVAWKNIVLNPLHEGTEVGIGLLAQDSLFFLTGKLTSYGVTVVHLNTEHKCILSYSDHIFLIYDKC